MRTPKDFFYEIFFNYFDDAGQMKSQFRETGYVDKNKEGFEYKISRGLGADNPGIWMDNQYILEVVFNDCWLGGITFYCSDEFVEGDPDPLSLSERNTPMEELLQKTGKDTTGKEEMGGENLDHLLQQLNNLVGLT